MHARPARPSFSSVGRLFATWRWLLPPAVAGLVACGGGAGDAGGDTGGLPEPGAPIDEIPWGGAAGSGGVGAAGQAGQGGVAGQEAVFGTGGESSGGGTSGAGGADPACPRVKVEVAAGASLNVRPTPSTAQAPIGELSNGQIVDLLAKVQGESIGGNDVWFQIAAPSLQGFIFSDFASCTLDEPVALPNGFYVPLKCGSSAKISQGNFGSFSHQGKAAYAFDFAIPVGTPMTAMADGSVIHIYDKTGPGDPCYNGGGSSCFPYANLVVLLHGDGTTTLYKHLSKVSVSMGQVVQRGTTVGLSGSTGYSTGPHAHVMRMENCGSYNCQSIPLKFADVPGGAPKTGETVKSGNCQ